ncbi:MAG: tRNA lysidine(34) synthetase TilS [Endomicrobiaceae bacterium]|jgi:tRNA(Ile)-lysidine synthase|nr:tRNA lysidine(34) synthetase TilS [Endomicrobiaceae bacterium]
MLIWEKFKKNIIENKIAVSGDKILLAVSGGADSVTMAHLFLRLKKILNIELVIVNFNHSLRKESAAEAKVVENFAKKNKIDFVLKTLQTKKYAVENNISVETAGRYLRYLNLEEIAKDKKCNKIATAHNMNDNAETVLMWLIRGTGTEGLSGIPAVRKISAKISIIRPLLVISRDLIDQYVKKHNLKFCTDKSNFTCDFTRNKIRLNIIPRLQELNPLVINHIFNLSNIVGAENDYFKVKVNSFILKHVKIQKDKINIKLHPFLRTEEILKYRILKEILPDKKRAVHINNIITWLSDKKSKRYTLSKLWIAVKTKDKIVFKQV